MTLSIHHLGLIRKVLTPYVKTTERLSDLRRPEQLRRLYLAKESADIPPIQEYAAALLSIVVLLEDSHCAPDNDFPENENLADAEQTLLNGFAETINLLDPESQKVAVWVMDQINPKPSPFQNTGQVIEPEMQNGRAYPEHIQYLAALLLSWSESASGVMSALNLERAVMKRIKDGEKTPFQIIGPSLAKRGDDRPIAAFQNMYGKARQCAGMPKGNKSR